MKLEKDQKRTALQRPAGRLSQAVRQEMVVTWTTVMGRKVEDTWLRDLRGRTEMKTHHVI